MSQTKRIEKHLKSGKHLTALGALSLYGCLRLSGRILELRESGMDIKTKMITVNKKRIAQYYL